MKIIDNINSNHNNSIQNMCLSADQMILVSPFLTDDFGEFIHAVALLGVEKITLITTLIDNSTDLFKKANSLYSFCNSCIVNKIANDIRIDNKLHGKIYIALKDNLPVKGIVTSANLTSNGLFRSHEWGVEIDDTSKLQDIINDLNKYSTAPLSHAELDSIIKTIDDYVKENETNLEPKPKLEVSKLIGTKLSFVPGVTDKSEIRYFIKPVGSSDDPYSINRVLLRDIQDMHFSKRKPNAVRPGDILICYGVGSTKLLGYFKVLTDPIHTNNMDRWPWKVESKNLCPNYSDNWIAYDNTLSSLRASYGIDMILTYAGGKTLGALNFGADKIRLTEDFANHILKIIQNTKG